MDSSEMPTTEREPFAARRRMQILLEASERERWTAAAHRLGLTRVNFVRLVVSEAALCVLEEASAPDAG